MIVTATLAYLAFIVATVAVLRAAKVRNRRERDTDHRDQHRRTR